MLSMLMFLKPVCTRICGNLTLLSISGNFWAVLELVILTGVSPIELFCCTVLRFLSLSLHLYIHCHMNVPGIMHHQLLNLLISELLKTLSYLSWFAAVILVLLKYKIVVSRIPRVFPFFFWSLSGSFCLTRIYCTPPLLSFYA